MVKGKNDKIKKHSAKALVVDDSSFMRTVLKDILLENGLSQIYEATNGKEAVEAYRKHRPDIVTMDIIMPGTNGLWAMKTILEIDPKAKIIVVTSLCQKNQTGAHYPPCHVDSSRFLSRRVDRRSLCPPPGCPNESSPLSCFV